MRRLWLEKQEKAFQIWLNALLTPQAAAPEDDGGLLAKRLYARVRGQIWHMYCSDPGVIGVMTRLEKRVDEGFLRMKAEVSLSWPSTSGPSIRCMQDACFARTFGCHTFCKPAPSHVLCCESAKTRWPKRTTC